jgi:hypothetical protein
VLLCRNISIACGAKAGTLSPKFKAHPEMKSSGNGVFALNGTRACGLIEKAWAPQYLRYTKNPLVQHLPIH